MICSPCKRQRYGGLQRLEILVLSMQLRASEGCLRNRFTLQPRSSFLNPSFPATFASKLVPSGTPRGLNWWWPGLSICELTARGEGGEFLRLPNNVYPILMPTSVNVSIFHTISLFVFLYNFFDIFHFLHWIRVFGSNISKQHTEQAKKVFETRWRSWLQGERQSSLHSQTDAQLDKTRSSCNTIQVR